MNIDAFQMKFGFGALQDCANFEQKSLKNAKRMFACKQQVRYSRERALRRLRNWIKLCHVICLPLPYFKQQIKYIRVLISRPVIACADWTAGTTRMKNDSKNVVTDFAVARIWVISGEILNLKGLRPAAQPAAQQEAQCQHSSARSLASPWWRLPHGKPWPPTPAVCFRLDQRVGYINSWNTLRPLGSTPAKPIRDRKCECQSEWKSTLACVKALIMIFFNSLENQRRFCILSHRHPLL